MSFDMRSILAQEPSLTPGGFHVRARETETLEEARARLLTPEYLHQFDRAREWLRHQPRTKRINQAAGTSYGLKHQAEHAIGYLANGAFIAAAIAEGFSVRRIERSPNAWLNISSTVSKIRRGDGAIWNSRRGRWEAENPERL